MAPEDKFLLLLESEPPDEFVLSSVLVLVSVSVLDVGPSVEVPSLPGWLFVVVDDVVVGVVGVCDVAVLENVVTVVIEVIVTSPVSEVGGGTVVDDVGGRVGVVDVGGGVVEDVGGGVGVVDDVGGGGVDDVCVDDVGGTDVDDVGGRVGEVLPPVGPTLVSLFWACTTATGVDAARISASRSAGATAFIAK
ncbi:hypothetical protein GGH95_004557 [Coemansia sp. RSA 1836]|nr:hypothetical protein GGH95_004557 [Coemansia sp. RSA 1836]